MSQYFINSSVLLQNSVGHGFTSAPSKCTIGYFAAYFANGTLPQNGTVCEADEKPLVDQADSDADSDSETVEKRRLPLNKKHWPL